MAKKREIKKDIEYLVSEVVSDCYAYLYINGDKNRDKVIDIISKAVDKRNEMIQRINNPSKEHNSKQLKAYYKTIYNEMLESVDAAFTELSKLSAKKK